MSAQPDLILHSFRRCPFAIRVRMVLEEKQIPFSVVEESLANPSEQLLALHPQGLVPLLRHGEHVVYESSVITEYLEDLFPTPPLMPQSPKDKSRVRLWTHWCNQIFKPDLDRFKYEFASFNELDRSQLVTRLNAQLDQLETALSGQPFLLGDSFTLADVHVFPFVRQFTRVRPAFPGLDKRLGVSRWLEGILKRPSFARVMAQP